MRLICLTVIALLSAITGAQAQIYPVKPVRLIVASAPGGAPDILARIVGQKLTDRLGQQVVVDNRAGASGIIGAELAAKAPADGYTLFLGTSTLYAILPNLRRSLPYDPVRDFASVSQIASASNVLVVSPSVAAKTVAELVQLAKTRPGTLNYASAGSGTPAHLAGEMLNVMAGIKATHVPYKGAGPALLDVIAGQVQFIITSPIAAGPHISSGKVRALATTGSKRNPAMPGLPTVAETLPGYEITQWWGLSAPAKTPPAIIRRLHADTSLILGIPDVQERLGREGAVAIGGTPQQLDAVIRSERERFGKVILQAGIPTEN